MITIPAKLEPGDEIRIVAPASSMSVISKDIVELARKKLEGEGFGVSFSKHAEELDQFDSSSIQSRVEDLHVSFKDENVKAILAVIGGFNSNQLLRYLDYELIRSSPKILCGYSDITALANAITAKTGLVTYSGPHFCVWAMKEGFDYTLSYFKKCLMDREPFPVETSEAFRDEKWWEDQENSTFVKNEGY